jgi:hypothetical protein
MRKFLKIILLSFFAVFLLSGAATAVPYPALMSPPIDQHEIDQGGPGNGTPTARDSNDGLPDIFDAINQLTSAGLTQNYQADPRFSDPDLFTQDGDEAFVALIGLTAGNSNTIGLYTDLGVGSVRTPLLPNFSGFGFTGDGSAADPYPGAMLPTSDGTTFGWYLESTSGSGTDSFLSQPALNTADNLDHMMVFALPELAGEMIWIDFGSGGTQLELVNPFLLAWEDILGGGDQDYDDMIYIFDQVLPGPEAVPEPATMLLLGSGLLGLAGYGRKKFLKKK